MDAWELRFDRESALYQCFAMVDMDSVAEIVRRSSEYSVDHQRVDGLLECLHPGSVVPIGLYLAADRGAVVCLEIVLVPDLFANLVAVDLVVDYAIGAAVNLVVAVAQLADLADPADD